MGSLDKDWHTVSSSYLKLDVAGIRSSRELLGVLRWNWHVGEFPSLLGIKGAYTVHATVSLQTFLLVMIARMHMQKLLILLDSSDRVARDSFWVVHNQTLDRYFTW